MNFEQLETETDATKGESDVEIDSFTEYNLLDET